MDGGTATRIDRLITDVGSIHPAVERAVRAVPRHRFIPPTGLAVPRDARPYLIDLHAEDDAWWQAVYSNTAIVTQLDDGATALHDLVDPDGRLDQDRADYTSSASAPDSVAALLELLDVRPGHAVLEIGTGTGWTAGLLAHLTGEHNVTSIEVDPAIAGQAAKNLAGAGIRPRLIIGDGAEGHAAGAPYDRVHVTCGIRAVPYAWVEQTRAGGVIVVPYCPRFGTDHALRLEVMPDGTAIGRFPGFASYMLMRSQRHRYGVAAPTDEHKHHFTTQVDPRTIGCAPPGAHLSVAAQTGLLAHADTGEDEHGNVYRLYVFDPADPHRWAVVRHRSYWREFAVYQVGDRPVWDEVVAAHNRWVRWGEPGRDRFGMTVGPDGQAIWLDTADRVIGRSPAV